MSEEDREFNIPEPTGKFVKGAYVIDPYYYRMMDMIRKRILVPDIFQYRFVKGAYVRELKPVEYGRMQEYGV